MSNNDLALIYRIAQMYCEKGLSQIEISNIENISRPHVSRLLDKARKLGIVEIRVKYPSLLETKDLEKQLMDELELTGDHIVSIEEDSFYSTQQLNESLATFSSNILGTYLQENQIIGVGWGRTIYQTSLYLDRMKLNSSTVVPFGRVLSR